MGPRKRKDADTKESDTSNNGPTSRMSAKRKRNREKLVTEVETHPKAPKTNTPETSTLGNKQDCDIDLVEEVLANNVKGQSTENIPCVSLEWVKSQSAEEVKKLISENQSTDEVKGQSKEEVKGQSTKEVKGYSKEEVNVEFSKDVKGQFGEEVESQSSQGVEDKSNTRFSHQLKAELKQDTYKADESQNDVSPISSKVLDPIVSTTLQENTSVKLNEPYKCNRDSEPATCQEVKEKSTYEHRIVDVAKVSKETKSNTNSVKKNCGENNHMADMQWRVNTDIDDETTEKSRNNDEIVLIRTQGHSDTFGKGFLIDKAQIGLEDASCNKDIIKENKAGLEEMRNLPFINKPKDIASDVGEEIVGETRRELNREVTLVDSLEPSGCELQGLTECCVHMDPEENPAENQGAATQPPQTLLKSTGDGSLAHVVEMTAQSDDIDDDVTDSQMCALDIYPPNVGLVSMVTAVSPVARIQMEEMEDGTGIMQGLIREAAQLNKLLLQTRREIEAARRHRTKPT